MSDEKLTRRLDFNDMFFTGVSYMIGAGIFSLMPFIIKYGGKNAWLAFIIGGIISIMTGLSFARLNFEYPVNPNVKLDGKIMEWGTFKSDSLPISEIAKNSKKAQMIIDQVGW